MKIAPLRPLAAMVLALFLCSCSAITVSEQPAANQAECSIDCAAMLQLLQQRQQRYQALSMLTRVKMDKNGKKWSSTQAVLVENQRRLRVDMLNFFGQLTMQLAVADTSLEAYVPSEHTKYTGLASNENIQRFIGIPLATDDLIALLLQKLPAGVLATAKVSTWERGLVLSRDSGASYRLTIVGRQVREVEYRVNSYVIYRMCYNDFAKDSGYPANMVLEFPLNKTVVKLFVNEVEVNRPMPADKFVLSTPAGTVHKMIEEM